MPFRGLTSRRLRPTHGQRRCAGLIRPAFVAQRPSATIPHDLSVSGQERPIIVGKRFATRLAFNQFLGPTVDLVYIPLVVILFKLGVFHRLPFHPVEHRIRIRLPRVPGVSELLQEGLLTGIQPLPRPEFFPNLARQLLDVLRGHRRDVLSTPLSIKELLRKLRRRHLTVGSVFIRHTGQVLTFRDLVGRGWQVPVFLLERALRHPAIVVHLPRQPLELVLLLGHVVAI